MDYSKESTDRQGKIQALKDAGVIPYANSYSGKQDIAKIRKDEDKVKDPWVLMESGALWEFKTAGRLMSSRGMWKLLFSKLRDHSGDIQLCFQKWNVVFNTGRETVEALQLDGMEKSAFKVAEKFCQVGDYIGVEGDLFLTKHGELTLFVKEFQILSKAVRPLPEKFHGVTDQETIYRQRYLDLIMNNESYDRFVFRSEFIKTIRDFYFKHDFLEIETPTLGNSASGAAAQPFTTHHNDFDEDFFLRIAPETGLKKATVGRFERVFEMGKNFRNEGSDPSHMQEFSVFEHYAVYWNFEDNMKFTEDMFDYVFDTMKLDRKVSITDKAWVEKTVDFSTPWKRIDYIAGVKEKSWIDIDAYGADDADKLRADIKAAWHTWEWIESQASATMIDYLYKKVLRPGIVGPAFVYNYPKTMQPLARQSDVDENIVEQFQLVLNGWEVLKAYSELVDPKLQQANFDAQSWALEAGDEEATSGDDDFVLAMEYGMPCQSGWGMWIDRIVSLLTGQDNLRDVVLFPTMKSEKKPISKKQAEKLYRSKKVVVIADESQSAGVVANAVGQLWIEIGGHCKEKLFETKILHDAEANIHYTDCLYGMTNLAGNQKQMAEFFQKCLDAGIQAFDFSDIMRKAHTDEEMLKWYKEKKTSEIGYIAVGALIPSDFEKEFLDGLQKFGA